MAALLDELMANAWPAEVTELVQGWRLRWTRGLSRRANSVLAVGGDDVPALVDRAEDFYRALRVPPVFQVSTASAPAELTPYLERRGYTASARTLVALADTAAVVASTPTSRHDDVVVTPTPTDEWFDTYWSVSRASAADAARAVCREVLLAPPLDMAFVSVVRDGAVAGVGQVVFEGEYAGVQCMATHPVHRRRGVGSAVLRALAQRAQERQVEHMYLAVMEANAAARGLYERSAFATVHEYEYLQHGPD